MSWSKEHVVLQPLIHWGPAWICYLGLLRVSLRQKFQIGLSINFLLQNDFKHNKYNKEECHKPYILSFGINNYKTNLLVPQVVIEWWLCNIKVMANWVPSEDILDLHQSFSSCYVLTCGGWREGGRGRMTEKKRERLIPSWDTTIKTTCQPGYLPKALLPNTITLGVKGGHNSIHTSYADLFLYIKTDTHFILCFTSYSFYLKYFWDEMNSSHNVHNEYLG